MNTQRAEIEEIMKRHCSDIEHYQQRIGDLDAGERWFTRGPNDKEFIDKTDELRGTYQNIVRNLKNVNQRYEKFLEQLSS